MSDTERPKPEQDAKTGRFVSGNIGGGRPKGSRNKLGEAFLQDMQEDWDKHGKQAIETVRQERPQDYLKVVASILPKEMNVNVREVDQLTDEELDGRIAQLAAAIDRLESGPRRDAGGKEKADRANGPH